MSEARANGVTRRRTAMLPVALVLVSLISLAIVPILIERRIRELRADITTVEDTVRHLGTTIQRTLAMESAGVRGYLLTGDTAYLATYHAARAERARAFTRLVPVARRLGTAVDEEARELARVFGQSDRAVDELLTGRTTPEQYIDSLELRQEQFTRATSAAARLDMGFAQVAAQRRAQVRATERLGLVLEGILVLLALIASILVAHLGRRYRSLAMRLDAQLTDRRRGAQEREQLLEAEQIARADSERKRDELERVTESRAALLRGFSHDVKNPLGAADGYLQLLEQEIAGPLNDKQKESVTRARTALGTALRLIGDLLNLARAETMQMERQPVDVRNVVREILEENRARAESKGLAIDSELSDELPVIESDAARVRQILGNLMSNAVKYTDAGRITVRAELRSRSTEQGTSSAIAIDVADTGPGIPKEQHPLLFREFQRLDASDGTTGAGIGLAISHRLARVLGGDITVSSEPGKGSVFTLWLPHTSRPQPPAAWPQLSSTARRSARAKSR